MVPSPDAKSPSGGSGDDLASRMIEEALADMRAENTAKDQGRKALDSHRTKRTKKGFNGVRGLLAIRSGFEQRVQKDAVEEFAKVESQTAANGVQN